MSVTMPATSSTRRRTLSVPELPDVHIERRGPMVRGVYRSKEEARLTRQNDDASFVTPAYWAHGHNETGPA